MKQAFKTISLAALNTGALAALIVGQLQSVQGLLNVAFLYYWGMVIFHLFLILGLIASIALIGNKKNEELDPSLKENITHQEQYFRLKDQSFWDKAFLISSRSLKSLPLHISDTSH